ncbi:MAG TPA: flavin prenyltransferase UbiX [Roseateles sp.]|jgi:4-hydroxy-3-polyprenylbenzoate decarboxylase|nr:flavin prenyltransferase UbiX [Roseateles sp.]HWT55047.1 flavin prenyltransferase UbiX [Rhodocyclaceae bacterium]
MKQRTIALGFTGASGMPYGMRLLECLLGVEDLQIHLVYSQAAQVVAQQEMGIKLSSSPSEVDGALSARFKIPPNKLHVYGREEWFAPMASGSNPPDAFVVCPCTMGTLGKIAAGISDDLLCRAADVVLKEGKKLILVPRETPFSVIHLENMLKLAKAGAVIMPPNPGFYHHPQSMQDLVDFVVARILDHLDIPHKLIAPWGE